MANRSRNVEDLPRIGKQVSIRRHYQLIVLAHSVNLSILSFINSGYSDAPLPFRIFDVCRALARQSDILLILSHLELLITNQQPLPNSRAYLRCVAMSQPVGALLHIA